MNTALQPLRVRISENNGLPWAQTQEYISLCRTVRQPGDPVAYNPPHPQGASPTDITQFQVGLAYSSINNLPDVNTLSATGKASLTCLQVFYQLWPSKEWWNHTRSARPLPKRDVYGNIMYERTPRQWAPRELLDYPILRNLDTISSEEEPWFLELLVRMDGRIEWADLLMRMEYPGTTELDEQKFRNRLQQRMARSREKFSMVSWRDTAGENSNVRDRVLSTLSPAQLAARGGLGSTRGSTPGSIDSQGKVIPVPGRRPRGTGNTTSVAMQQHQQQPQMVTSIGFSGAAPQQLPNQTAASSYASPSPQVTSPITRGQRHPNAASKPSPQSWSSVSNGVNGYIQYVGEPKSNGAPSSNGKNQPNNPYAGFVSGKYVKRGHSAVEASPVDGYIPSRSHPSSAGGGDAEDEDEWSGEDDRSEDVYDSEASHDSLESYDREENSGSEESHDNYDSDNCEDNDNGDEDNNCDGSDGSDEHDQHPRDDENGAEMLSAKVNYQNDRESAHERSKWERYLERDRNGVYNYLDGHITREELFMEIDQNRAQLKASLKRVREEIGDDEEVEEMHSQRIKRTRRRGGSLLGDHLPTFTGTGNSHPEPLEERNREDGVVYASRHPARPITSAVERLHHDRARRPAPKATTGQEKKLRSINYPHPNNTTGDTEYTIYNSRIASQQSHDDPFFSDELFNGMLTGQPNNNHIGSIYTISQQREHDEHYDRLMIPRNTKNHPQHPPPPPQPVRVPNPSSASVAAIQNPDITPYPQLHIPYNIPPPPPQDAAPPLPAPASNNTPELDFEDFCEWNHDWYGFAMEHDAVAVLGALFELGEGGGEEGGGVEVGFELELGE
ncbi:hypothetical protein BDR22DRAFT_907134 [Usnea florida]